MPQQSALYKAARKTMVEYFQNTSLHGFRLLYYIRKRKIQRIFWFGFILMGISLAAYVVMYTLISYVENPTVTSLATQYHPIWDIPFPGVAVCSVNKISLAAIKEYAKDISRRNNEVIDEETLLKKFRLFGGYFENGFDFDEAIKLQNFLDDTSGFYNVSDILRRLAPRCEHLMRKCSWAGEEQPCSELFSLQATAVGNCCIFNYQHRIHAKKALPVKYPIRTGVNGGLILLLNTSTADYFFTDRSTNGFTIQIFGTDNFADSSTGGFEEALVYPHEDVTLKLSVVSQVTSQSARKYSVNQRHCYFPDENFAEYGLAYSKGECLTKCKIQSVLALCGCIPFYTPINYIDWKSTVNYCTLAHMECLERYRVTWNTYRPTETVIPAELQQDSISCPKCLPLCTFNRYGYQKLRVSLPETIEEHSNKQFLQHVTDLKKTSLVRVYFASPYSTLYRKNVLYNWYQILATIGGVIGVSMGCSFISFFELIYFLFFRFYENLRHFRKTASLSVK